MSTETRAFQAETRQLLDIVIHSLYSNKEIFLRELISNSSDALDRLRFEALTHPEVMEKDEVLEIRLEADADAHTLSIIDNGIGMSRDEVIENLGTIAKSGTRELMSKLEEQPADSSPEQVASLIGQFGVGFYSAFMVADRVTVVTRRQGEEVATRWDSEGGGEYEVTDDHRFARGTTVTLHLKPVDEEHGLENFTDFFVIQRIVKRYSDFIPYAVKTEQTREEPERDESGAPIEGKTKTVVEEVILNSMKPIWTRPASEVSDEEINEFYRHISHDWTDPLDVVRLHAEGRIEYQALLFLPSKAPFDLYYRDQSYGLQLYVRRILIMDRCEELLPTYLRFVKGVVDSSDLPLNVSREMIQHDRHITQMRRWLTRKVLDHLGTMKKDDEDKFIGLFKEFGRVLKEGVASDADNKDRIAPLLYFPTSHDEEKPTTLDGYVERMKDEQDAIYYLTGESRGVIEASPHLEAFRAKEYEVLYLDDPVDEMVVQSLNTYQEKPLKSVGKGEIELGSEEEREKAKEELKEKKDDYESLLGFLQTSLDDHIKEARLSARLTSSPACLVGSEFDLSPQLERMLRQTEGGERIGKQKRILEINPDHPIATQLRTRHEQNADDPKLAGYAQLLHGYALLAEGSPLPDPGNFNRLVAELMTEQLGG
ncbi:MAG: molecular chaperone HtpG [Acidobacteriota bacterium]